MTTKTQHELWPGSEFVIQYDSNDDEFPFSIHARTDASDNSICNNKLIQLSASEAQATSKILRSLMDDHYGWDEEQPSPSEGS